MDTRTWSDSDLRDAVSSQSSWRGVLRALGLKGTSGKSISVVRNHAIRLGLDTSHFTLRKWSDADLAQAMEVADSWNEILHQLGLADERRAWARVKRRAHELGLDIEPFDRPTMVAALPEPQQDADLDHLRHAATSIASAWFTLRGMRASIPGEGMPYDLVVDTPTGFKRVQVKTTTCRTTTDTWHVGIGHRPTSMTKQDSKVPYDPDSIDLFWIVDADGFLYLIPIEAVAGMMGLYLRSYTQYRVGNVSGLFGFQPEADSPANLNGADNA